MSDWRTNNFDLIRLMAAAQVLVVHAAHSCGVWGDMGAVNHLLLLFPGVPIFFVVSGFLISRSYEHAAALPNYLRNRALRIYPALWVCLVFSALLPLATQSLGEVHTAVWALWWLAQMSGAQGYQPSFLDGFGTGTFNGSLWTIPVELSFYLLLPLIYRSLRLGQRRGSLGLLWFFVPSVAIFEFWVRRLDLFPDIDLWRALGASLLPYLWMFLLGVFLQRNFERWQGWFAGRAPWWLLAYALVVAVSHLLEWRTGGHGMNPLAMATLAGLVVSTAFTMPSLSERILRGNDFSYGLYIYHMPVINLLVQLGLARGYEWLPLALTLPFIPALLSWWLVERPMLRQKRQALHPLAPSAGP